VLRREQVFNLQVKLTEAERTLKSKRVRDEVDNIGRVLVDKHDLDRLM
jgi:hypothetical protein